jgi:hypothetical protein
MSGTALGLQPWLVLGLLAIALTVSAYLPFQGALSSAVADPPAPGVGAAPAPANPVETAFQLANTAAQAYQNVHNYTCTLIQQERIKGRLQPENVMLMKFRKEPFSIYMRWTAPKDAAGREVAYIHGRNNNEMRVRNPGLLYRLGFISVKVNDPRALEHSRHMITEAGMGNLIAQLQADWGKARQDNRTQVRIADYLFANRPCTRVEGTRVQRSPQDYCYRVVVYFDKENHMPVRMECYDWPRQGGTPDGVLLECYSYVNLRVNEPLGDGDFAR